MKVKKLAGNLIIISLMTGCSAGALTLYQTQETINVGNEVVSETKNYFTALTELQAERAAFVLAAQPNCTLSKNWEITVRKNENPNINANVPLCATAVDYQRENTTKIDLMPLKKEIFQNDLDILASFSDYLHVLTVYTKDPDYPIEGLVENALDNAKNVNGKEGFTAQQKNAISGLVVFLTRLAAEAQNGRNIGTTLKSDGPKQSDNLELLKKHIQNLKENYNDTMSKDIVNFSAELFNKRISENNKDSSLNEARKFVTLKSQIEMSIIQPTAAEIAIEKFQKYNNGLISIINGDITDEKLKEKQIEIQKNNLKEGLGHIKDLVKEFSPLLIAAI